MTTILTKHDGCTNEVLKHLASEADVSKSCLISAIVQQWCDQTDEAIAMKKIFIFNLARRIKAQQGIKERGAPKGNKNAAK